MEVGLGVGHLNVRLAVVRGCVSLSEVVCLHLGCGASKPLPVDLIEIIGLENGRGHDSGSRRGLHHNGDDTEKDIEVGLDRRGITRLGNGVDGTVGVIVGQTAVGDIPVVARSLGEVDAVRRLIQALVCTTSLCLIMLACCL